MTTTPVGLLNREAVIAGVLDLRLKMDQVLEQIANGVRSLSEVLQPCDDLALNQLYMVKILESFSSIGKIRARQALDELKISHKLKACNLSEQQRTQLLGVLQCK